MFNPLSVALSVHILGIIVWVGGMFFAHQALRPAIVEVLEPPQRLSLWVATFKRFFLWVWISIVLVLVSGLWMLSLYPQIPVFMHIMLGLGVIMMLIFLHVFFAPYKKLKQAVAEERWVDGAKALGQIRLLVGINLSIGLVTTIVATAGKFYL
ncbi:MAG: CopD family protein [Cocleimonas sp.]|nr:CopD family protein [Cocleimonas sp.]